MHHKYISHRYTGPPQNPTTHPCRAKVFRQPAYHPWSPSFRMDHAASPEKKITTTHDNDEPFFFSEGGAEPPRYWPAVRWSRL